MKTKAQGAIEFIIIIGALLFFAISFFIIVQRNIEEKNVEKEAMIVENIALSIQDELALAKQSSEGYSREFNIVETISGKNYELNIINNRIYIKTNIASLSFLVVEVNGTIKKGINKIKKENGQVYLN